MDRFVRYGGRGITVCERWRLSFTDFFADVGPSPSPHHTLGRINNEGNYEPGNVEWQDRYQQARNTSASRVIEHDGLSMTLGEWAARVGINRQTIQMRIDRYGWSVAEALTRATGR